MPPLMLLALQAERAAQLQHFFLRQAARFTRLHISQQNGPNRSRFKRSVLWPTASSMRRTCRFLPSWIVIRNDVSPAFVGRTCSTRAGAVIPSSSETPLTSKAISEAASFPSQMA